VRGSLKRKTDHLQKLFLSLVVAGVCLLAGCASSDVSVHVKNVGTVPLEKIEVTYPGGSFGIAKLEPGKSFHYTLKPTGAGTMDVSWPQKDGKPLKNAGPKLDKDFSGTVLFEIAPDRFTFYTDARKK